MARNAILKDGQEALQVLIDEIKAKHVPVILEEIKQETREHLMKEFREGGEAFADSLNEARSELEDLSKLTKRINSLQSQVSHLKAFVKKASVDEATTTEEEAANLEQVCASLDARLTAVAQKVQANTALLASGATGKDAPVGPLASVYSRLDGIVEYIDEVDAEAEERWRKIRKVAGRFGIN